MSLLAPPAAPPKHQARANYYQELLFFWPLLDAFNSIDLIEFLSPYTPHLPSPFPFLFCVLCDPLVHCTTRQFVPLFDFTTLFFYIPIFFSFVSSPFYWHPLYTPTFIPYTTLFKMNELDSLRQEAETLKNTIRVSASILFTLSILPLLLLNISLY